MPVSPWDYPHLHSVWNRHLRGECCVCVLFCLRESLSMSLYSTPWAPQMSRPLRTVVGTCGAVWPFAVGCISEDVNETHFPRKFFSTKGLQWLPERGSRPCTHSLTPSCSCTAGVGAGSWLRALVWVGLVSPEPAEKPPHLACLLNHLKKLFFSPLLKIFMYIVGDLENKESTK